MVQAYRTQPENVLRYMGEFLIAQSIRQSPSQNTEIANHFLYDHSEPRNAPTSSVQAQTETSAQRPVETTTTDVTFTQIPVGNGAMDVKTEADGDVTMGSDGDQVMADGNMSIAATEPTLSIPPTS